MTAITINAEPRELTGRDTDQLREQGKIPVTIYGPKVKTESAQVDRNQLAAALSEVGGGSLVSLVFGDKEEKVLIKDVQHDPITDLIVHADLYEVDMTKPVSATVDLHFIGSSAAVKELGGTLVRARDTIEVRGLPDKLVPFIEVDISALKTFDQVIYIKDLNIPEGLELDIDSERAVALVNAPRTEAEMNKLDEAPEVAVPAEGEEGSEGEKKEGEETPDGEQKGDGKSAE
ncbi:MAG: 50S ribosomal protein L25 [Candidatus Uhrbacteria bacterium]